MLLKLVGIHPVIVHGGGPQINAMLEKVGKKSEFVQGMRVTDKEAMDIVEMVLGGHVNKEIVSMIYTYGGHAIPAQAGIQTCRHGNLSGKKVSLDFTS